MKEILCRTDYEQQIAASRDRRMQWWREARFGLFIHYGLYDGLPPYRFASDYPQLHGGQTVPVGSGDQG